jgi:N-acetylglucosamine-6-phosphate deacetylase
MMKEYSRMRQIIKNARLADAGGEGTLADLIIDDGMITAVTSADERQRNGGAEVVRDIEGAWACPGFIDLHTHGADGADVMDATPEVLATIARQKRREGVTTFCPTTMTAPDEAIEHALRAIAEYEKNPALAEAARTRGAHIEGPFLNPRQAGAQDAQWMRSGDWDTIERWRAVGPISLLTLAPEREGHEPLIEALVTAGVRVSLGHSAATRADFLRAKAAGATQLTHFANQMSPLHHRELGLVGSGLLDDTIRLEVIADGVHLSDDMLCLLLKTVPLRRLMLITDSISAAARADGDYMLGGQTVQVRAGQARLVDGTLAGSTLIYLDGLRRLARLYDGPWTDLLITTAANQAEVMGWSDLGQLRPGACADLVILDDQLHLHASMVGGHWMAH